MSAAVNNVTEQPDAVSSFHGQAVRQVAVPFACMVRHTSVCIGVADAAAGVVISVDTTRVSGSPSFCCYMLLTLLL